MVLFHVKFVRYSSVDTASSASIDIDLRNIKLADVETILSIFLKDSISLSVAFSSLQYFFCHFYPYYWRLDHPFLFFTFFLRSKTWMTWMTLHQEFASYFDHQYKWLHFSGRREKQMFLHAVFLPHVVEVGIILLFLELFQLLWLSGFLFVWRFRLLFRVSLPL